MTILDLLAIADERNIPVDYLEMGYAESMSIEDNDRRCYIALDNTTYEGEPDLKIHLAHELGHCLCGAFYTYSADAVTRAKAEAKAKVWAIETLVPKDKLAEFLQEIDSDFQGIADYFGVSPEFLHSAIEYYRESSC